ncbi:MAG: hypothetical protein KDK70_16315, partial [Myxococcales bacterium]|nr:hypothetical protein [Myxococcales bacterium]
MPARPSISHDCPHCHARASVTRPSRAWKAALVAGYVVLAAMGVAMALAGIAGPFTVLPAVVIYALGTLPFLHARASEPATCEACGKIVQPSAATDR